jgi:putative transposase
VAHHRARRRARTLHHLTSRLAKPQAAVAIGAGGFSAFRRRLRHEVAWYGCQVIVANRWAPTSQTRSICGRGEGDLTLVDWALRCERCGLVIDRDLNAAVNLMNLAGSSSDSQNVCGEESAGRDREALVNLSSAQQESDAFDVSA